MKTYFFAGELIALFLLISLISYGIPCVVSAGEGTMSSTLKNGTKFEAEILERVQINSFIESTDMFILRMEGNYTSAHPDFDDNPHIDPKSLAKFSIEFPRIVEARPIRQGSKLLLLTGKILTAHIVNLKTLHSTMDDFPMYSEGAIWIVKEPIPFGYTDKSKETLRVLSVGKYRIGPSGVPNRIE